MQSLHSVPCRGHDHDVHHRGLFVSSTGAKTHRSRCKSKLEGGEESQNNTVDHPKIIQKQTSSNFRASTAQQMVLCYFMYCSTWFFLSAVFVGLRLRHRALYVDHPRNAHLPHDAGHLGGSHPAMQISWYGNIMKYHETSKYHEIIVGYDMSIFVGSFVGYDLMKHQTSKKNQQISTNICKKTTNRIVFAYLWLSLHSWSLDKLGLFTRSLKYS